MHKFQHLECQIVTASRLKGHAAFMCDAECTLGVMLHCCLCFEKSPPSRDHTHTVLEASRQQRKPLLPTTFTRLAESPVPAGIFHFASCAADGGQGFLEVYNHRIRLLLWTQQKKKRKEKKNFKSETTHFVCVRPLRAQIPPVSTSSLRLS